MDTSPTLTRRTLFAAVSGGIAGFGGGVIWSERPFDCNTMGPAPVIFDNNPSDYSDRPSGLRPREIRAVVRRDDSIVFNGEVTVHGHQRTFPTALPEACVGTSFEVTAESEGARVTETINYDRSDESQSFNLLISAGDDGIEVQSIIRTLADDV